MAGGAFRSLTIELNASTSGLDAALRKSNTEATKLEKELKQAQKAAKLDGAGADTFARQMDLMAQRIDAARAKLERLNAVAAKEGALDADGKMQKLSADAWSKLNYEIEKTNAEIQQYTKMMRELSASQGAANSALGRAGAAVSELGERLVPVGERMQRLGNAMTMGVTMPIVGAATASVKAATDINTALTGVRKTLDASEEDYQALKDAAVEFSKVNGVTAAQLLDIEALGAQLGFGHDNLDELKEFAEVVAGLDIATNLDAETAATELAQFANIMGMSHDEVDNFASSLVDLGNHFSTTESDVMNMSMRIAGAGKTLGLTEADVLGLSTALASVGIKAEMGGTAISTILSNIDKDVALNSENVEKWAQIAGYAAEDFAAAWNEDTIGTFQHILAGMNESDENLAVLLDELGISSLRQTDVMKRLVNASELLPNAVETANRAYEENIALGNEVANFNDSLAVKFEMVRNRITAVAAEIGEPLADAFLEIIDAAEPLFQAIEEGARAFSEMSDEEQMAVVQTVAIVAALGPALSIFGKVTANVKVLGGAMSTLASWFAKLDVATGGAKVGFEQVAGASGNMAEKLKPASVAMGALKGAAIGLAVAGIAVLASAIADYLAKQEEFTKATVRMQQTAERLPSAFDVAAKGVHVLSGEVDDAAGSWTNYAQVAEESARKAAELTDKINESFAAADADSREAQRYADAIRQLAGNCDGSADKLFELKDAVSRYNELTGSSISVVDDFSGRISANTAELEANTKAFKLNAYMKAAGEAYSEAVKLEIDAEAKLNEAMAQQNDLLAGRAELEEQIRNEADDTYRGQLNGQLEYQNELIEKGEEGIRSLTAQRDAAAKSAEGFLDAEKRYSAELENQEQLARSAAANVDGFTDALRAAGEGSEAFAELAGYAEMSADDFGTALTRAGLKSQDLAKVGSESFRMLYDKANGNIDAVSQLLIALDSMQIDPKTLTVNEDGTLSDAEGHVIDLDNMTIDGKTFSVYVEDYATSVLRSLRDLAYQLDGFVVNMRTQVSGSIGGLFGNAEGGLSRVPIQVARHADGGIAKRATLTNVGLVGEAGAEAIIPLTNTRYVRPFAQAVASQMGGGGGTTVNASVVLQYDAGSDAMELATDVARYIDDLMNVEG